MDLLKIHFENCYGINRLTHDFSFTKNGKRNQSYCIYASNGVMKTSFAKTFMDYSEEAETKDKVHPDMITKRTITDENLSIIPPDSVFVAESYNDKFESDKTSRLLVDEKLRKQYEEVKEKLELNKNALMSNINETGNMGRTFDLENELRIVFEHEDIYRILKDLKDSISDNNLEDFSEIPYGTLFNNKTEAIMQEKSFIEDLKLYTEKYNSLLKSSKIFHLRDFDYLNARKVSDALDKNGFFTAGNTIHIKGIDDKEIETQAELKKIIENEINSIMNDPGLRKTFDKIEKKLKKNEQLAKFSNFLSLHPELIPELINPALLKQKILKSYIKVNESRYIELLDTIEQTSKDISIIKKATTNQKTSWHDIIDIFNNRFHVPFTVKIANETNAILGQDTPMFEFYYGNKNKIDKNTLLDILSTGEKRALYILNLLYEVEARRHSKEDTIIIMDDIVDSFDYKNKYAIIEYLEEISNEEHFYLIILTHNFDFFRTIESRNIVPYNYCLTATREKNAITLNKASYIKNPFLDFSKHADEPSKLISLIPFVRNLIEYSDRDYLNNEDYAKLTSILHIKNYTNIITVNEIKEILAKHICIITTANDGLSCRTIMRDYIFKTAGSIITSQKMTSLEHKIALSIAIRLQAEAYILKNDKQIDTSNINSNQTRFLISNYLKNYNINNSASITLKKVNLITPENIHLNAFMYEPIIDMSIDELKTLYLEISNL